MINIAVYSNSNVSIENTEYHIDSQEDMVNFIKALLDKAYYAGERLCLEAATINESEGKVYFKEIDRWT